MFRSDHFNFDRILSILLLFIIQQICAAVRNNNNNPFQQNDDDAEVQSSRIINSTRSFRQQQQPCRIRNLRVTHHPSFRLDAPPLPQYVCDPQTETCARLELDEYEAGKRGTSQDVCQATCGQYGSLWPKPRGITNLSRQLVSVSMFQPNITFNHFSYILDSINHVYQLRWQSRFGQNCPWPTRQLRISVDVKAVNGNYQLLTDDFDESYSLQINTTPQAVNVLIKAVSPFGARHGLETLDQLLTADDFDQQVLIPGDGYIKDSPAFPYRGISIDVSRHFYPIPVLKNLIDGLSYNKMNALHLHLTDAQAFPVQILSRPNMTKYGAYGPDKIYGQKDLIELHSYAYYRGVRLVPEIDAPSHVAYGWEWGNDDPNGPLLLCKSSVNTKDCYGPPCGYLNPINPSVYKVLEDVYKEVLSIFYDTSVFHLGGDEVSFYCWQNNTHVQSWVQNILQHFPDDEGMMQLWAYFERKVLESLNVLSKGTARPILWSSSLTETTRIKSLLGSKADNLIVEFWGNKSTNDIPKLLDQNIPIILANHDAWYLDCGGGIWVGQGPNWCSPYKDWRTAYNNYMHSGPNWTVSDAFKRSLILGGEGAIWSETINADNLDGRVWPRGSAIGERLWTNPSDCWLTANTRLMAQHRRMKSYGIKVEPVQPEWCDQHEGSCVVPPSLWKELHVKNTCPQLTN